MTIRAGGGGGAINDALEHVTWRATHLLPRCYICVCVTADTSYILSSAIRQFDHRAPIIITITSNPFTQTIDDIFAAYHVLYSPTLFLANYLVDNSNEDLTIKSMEKLSSVI